MNALKPSLIRQFLPLLVFLSYFAGPPLLLRNGLDGVSFLKQKESSQHVQVENTFFFNSLDEHDKPCLVYEEAESLSEQENEDTYYEVFSITSQLIYTKLSKLCSTVYYDGHDIVQKFGVPLYDMYCSRRHHLS